MKKHYLLTTVLSIILSIPLTTNTHVNDNTPSLDVHSNRAQTPLRFNLPVFDFDVNTVMVDVNGDAFPVVDSGEGPVVLLIHGWPDSKEMWRYQIPFLIESGYRVIAPDLRGFGDAPKTEDVAAYGLGSLMGDVITILDNII